jgi:hypothetical protein
VYKSLAISFGQKMAWIIPVGHLPKKLHLQVEFRLRQKYHRQI